MENDVDWTQTPSNHNTDNFRKLSTKLEKLISGNVRVFSFVEEKKEIKQFVSEAFKNSSFESKAPVTKSNFVWVFQQWEKAVRNQISVNWETMNKRGVISGDFFLADLLSKDGDATISGQNLKVILKGHKYELSMRDNDELFTSQYGFKDGGAAYNLFWGKYQRPPREDVANWMRSRRDLLVPKNVREVKGAFFTPAIWVQKSREYLAEALGENWQSEYIIWDPACGTGNLLANLTDPQNVYGSTLDSPDVQTIHSSLIEGGPESILELGDWDTEQRQRFADKHFFQFDFLNDELKPKSKDGKIPDELYEILIDSEERKKLLIYMNPPYAEAGSKLHISKEAVQKTGISKTQLDTSVLGRGARELFAQFMWRCYSEMNGVKIGEFSKLKILLSSNYKRMREHFRSSLEKCFIVPAVTFDNVSGSFPIGFKIWFTDANKEFSEINADVFNQEGDFLGVKILKAFQNNVRINPWLKSLYQKEEKDSKVAYLSQGRNDFQNVGNVFIYNDDSRIFNSDFNQAGVSITPKNLIPIFVYFAVQRTPEATWLNDRDQFLEPSYTEISVQSTGGLFSDMDAPVQKVKKYDYESDVDFINNCVVYTLFNNNISMKHGTNHWIPFSEKETGAISKYQSHFIIDWLKVNVTEYSPEAQAVMDAGLELWKYYVKQSDSKVDASLRDIMVYFQDTNEKGKLNNLGRILTHEDGTEYTNSNQDLIYIKLRRNLMEKLETLTMVIVPKVYAYGFLKNDGL